MMDTFWNEAALDVVTRGRKPANISPGLHHGLPVKQVMGFPRMHLGVVVQVSVQKVTFEELVASVCLKRAVGY